MNTSSEVVLLKIWTFSLKKPMNTCSLGRDACASFVELWEDTTVSPFPGRRGPAFSP